MANKLFNEIIISIWNRYFLTIKIVYLKII